MQPTMRVFGEKESRKDLLKRLHVATEAQHACMRTLGALLLQANGRILIPAENFSLLDPDMTIKQEAGENGRDMVLTLLVPKGES